MADLRELARGIHPAVLTDHGLDAGVRTLAERAPIPVEIRATDKRLPGEVETAVYFIVAEALANVAKHSRASKAWVRIEQRNGAVRVEVGDDGAGGAALDGRLSVDSPVGGGTRVLVEIPCAS